MCVSFSRDKEDCLEDFELGDGLKGWAERDGQIELGHPVEKSGEWLARGERRDHPDATKKKEKKVSPEKAKRDGRRGSDTGAIKSPSYPGTVELGGVNAKNRLREERAARRRRRSFGLEKSG